MIAEVSACCCPQSPTARAVPGEIRAISLSYSDDTLASFEACLTIAFNITGLRASGETMLRGRRTRF